MVCLVKNFTWISQKKNCVSTNMELEDPIEYLAGILFLKEFPWNFCDLVVRHVEHFT